MNLIDIIVIIVTVSAAFAGYRRGFLDTAAAAVGVGVGAAVGVAAVPFLFSGTVTVATASMAVAFVAATTLAGRSAAGFVADKFVPMVKSPRALVANAAAGAVFGSAMFFIAATLVASMFVGTRMDPLASTVQSSSVLMSGEKVRPQIVDDTVGLYMAGTFVPRYVAPFAPQQYVEVAAPDTDAVNRSGVESARASVVKVRGASECGVKAGTGFLYESGRVMTNAHVVAGATQVDVTVGDDIVAAEVVVFDADLDLAVLDVETDAAPLSFADGVAAGDDAVVLGFPGGGDYTSEPVRVRAVKALRSPNGTVDATVVRDVVALRGVVLGGNSGGPVVNTDGEVVGVVFSASATHEDTGYALTVEQVADVAEAGRTADTEVSTGMCR